MKKPGFSEAKSIGDIAQAEVGMQITFLVAYMFARKAPHRHK